MYLGKINEAAR